MGLLAYVKEIERAVDRINQKWQGIMAQVKDFDNLITKLNDATTKLGEKIKKLTDEISAGGLTDQQENDKLSQLNAIGDTLVQMGQDPANPVPPVTV